MRQVASKLDGGGASVPTPAPTPAPVSRTDSAAIVDERTKIREGLGLSPVPETNNVAKLAPEQYPTKEIVTYYGGKETVYTSGPLAGQIVGQPGIYANQASSDVSDAAKVGDLGSGGTGVGSGGSGVVGKELTPEDKDAIAIMTSTLKQWGLESLADTYGRLMVQGFTPGEALNKLKYDKTVDPVTNKPWNADYTLRFAGNAARVAKGLNAYDEATYLDVENQYADTLNKYGLGNMIKATAGDKHAQFAGYMANDIAPTEFADRISTVADRVINMDPAIKAQFQAYYPSLTNTDIVSYFLDPKETLPVLKNKVTAAEIGAVAGAAKYGIGEERAMDLAKYGVSRERALVGYQDIAEVTPTAGKLSSIYNEEDIKYGQTEAENEFLKQDAQAKLKRNRLASKERAMFSGSSGVNADTFGRNNNF